VKSKMLYKEFICELYKCPVLFYAGCGHKEFIEHVKTHYNILIDDNLTCMKGLAFWTDLSGVTHYGVWMRKKRQYEVLVHECLHLTYRIFKDRGIPVGHNNDEAVAYYVGYWFDKFYNELKKRKK
jgi:hypothetical protein